MTRIITISGLSFTGTTTLAIELARVLQWNYLSAGERFRQFCAENNLSITSIPIDVHVKFDQIIQEEIRNLQRTVMEGRYLGLFAQGYIDVIKVLIESDTPVRQKRCLQREDRIRSLDESLEYIQERDTCEHGVGNTLYDSANFVQHTLYDLIVRNNQPQDFSEIIERILKLAK